jgi:hypothetical protein
MGKRTLLIVGTVLLGLGLWVFTAKPEFERDKEVLKLGELSATVRQSESLPSWVGPLPMVLGGALAGAALLRGR